jgi:hypothetical protein
MISINGKMVGKNIRILTLPHRNLTFLSTEIGQLTRLIELSLFHNELTFLPTEIGKLI